MYFQLLVASLLFGYAICSDVISVTQKNFQKEVASSKLPVMVKFYAPWCGHCKALAPTWEKVATNLKGVVSIVKIDCTSEGALCQKYGIQGYPTLKVFKDKGKTVDYSGGRDASSIIKFATSQIKNLVFPIRSTADLDKFLQKGQGQPHVILFSKKAQANSAYQALSALHEGKLVLGQVKSDLKDVVEKYAPIDSFPHLITIQGESVEHFQGTVDSNSLRQHINSLVGGKPDEEKPQEPPKKKPSKVAVTKPSLGELTSENLATNCGSSLCVIGFVNTADGKPLPEQVTVLNSLLDKFYKDAKFSYFWVSCEKEKDMCTKFGVSTQPAVAVYNHKRKKISISTSFKEEELFKILERARGGDLSYTKLEL